MHYFDVNKIWISYLNHGIPSPSNAKCLVKCISKTVDLNTVQIEEGTVVTSYTPYNEKYKVEVILENEQGIKNTETIYLNSPLLKGDRIEMYNGKLCHYHKMGKIVLNGSESWQIHSTLSSSGVTIPLYTTITNIKKNGYHTISSNFITGLVAPEGDNIDVYMDKEMITGGNEYNQLFIRIPKPKLPTPDENGFKQWLQANPTTVVYELAEPYYEEITPEHNEFTIVSIGESSFTIDSGNVPTDSEVTYNVNVKLLNDLEENMNNNTSSTNVDLTTILDDIINE
jgi:hypothetical protein